MTPPLTCPTDGRRLDTLDDGRRFECCSCRRVWKPEEVVPDVA